MLLAPVSSPLSHNSCTQCPCASKRPDLAAEAVTSNEKCVVVRLDYQAADRSMVGGKSRFISHADVVVAHANPLRALLVARSIDTDHAVRPLGLGDRGSELGE